MLIILIAGMAMGSQESSQPILKYEVGSVYCDEMLSATIAVYDPDGFLDLLTDR